MKAEDQTLSAVDRRAAWTATLLLAAVAGFYLVRGMPWCDPDDFAWVGTGIELARSGQLANHPMDGWLAGFGTDKFYVQLPFSVYSLAGWILVFGSTPESFVVFTWLWYAAGCFGLERMLRRFGLPAGMRWLMALIYLNTLIDKGFRPEAEAFGLMFAGLGLLDTAAPFWRKMAALVLVGLGVLTYPIVVALAVPFSVAMLWLQRPESVTASAGWRAVVRAWALPVALAVGVVVLAFLAMIHFELGAFWKVFDAHRRSRGSTGGALVGYFHLITRLREGFLTLPPTLLLPVVVGYVAARWPGIETRVRALVAACAVAAVGCIFLYEVRAPEWVVLLAFCAACAVVSGAEFRRARWRIVLGLAALYVWSMSLWFMDAVMRQLPDPVLLRHERALALQSGKELIVDSSTARNVFRYQLPPGTRHLEYVETATGHSPVKLADLRGKDYWLVTAPVMEIHGYEMPAELHNYPHVTIAGHTFKSAALCPDQPVVIP